MHTVELAENTTGMNVVSHMVDILLGTIIAKPLDSQLSNDEKEEVLIWRNALLKKVKDYIDVNLNPAKVNVIDPTKVNFTQSLSVQEILDGF